MNHEQRAAIFFVAEEEIAAIAPFGAGNVNDTFLLTLTSGEERVLQRVNPAVFPDPGLVMRNLRRVSEHLGRTCRNGQTTRIAFQPLRLFSGRNGDAFVAEDGGLWRLLNRVSGQSRPAVRTSGEARELGRGLGRFHRLTTDLDPETLADPLPGFHVTPRYLAHYDQVCGRPAGSNRPPDLLCREFIEGRRELAGLLATDRNDLRRTIIHGDPKVANFLFDEQSGQVVSLIDLDTVQPGLLLVDLGDALRSCCNPAGEMPGPAAEPRLDPDLFAAWLEGYLGEAGPLPGPADLALLVEAVALITFELGLRFYTDHLEGDRYFQGAAPGENLARAHAQFRLVRSIEEQRESLAAIVARLAAGQP